MDSNCQSLLSEVTALPTELLKLLKLKYCTQKCIHKCYYLLTSFMYKSCERVFKLLLNYLH